MFDRWIAEVKKQADPEGLGMVLIHNGLVRATSKEGRPVRGMTLSYDTEKLERAVAEHRKREGITDIRVWINSGELQVGDDIMRLLVAGRFRTDVLPVFESLLTMIKREIVREQEIE
ncbi:MAG: molybdenum cofactor biosynthesis protein MoaE [Desulfobacterota bacterium]|jgi:molybdopterin synthase catalytic subunit|nr:molybdenum cofactor biosynthesis protein MoaE [Thermodesulfobacteriota bacterium]